jgi:error-prone DNA polymerase
VWQRDDDPDWPAGYGPVRNLVARRLQDLSDWLGALTVDSRDFR